MIEDIDVDQLVLNKSNLEASLINLRSQRNIAYKLSEVRHGHTRRPGDHFDR